MIVTRLLAGRARRHLRDGLPPVAMFAFDYIGNEIAVRGRFEREELSALADFLAPLADRFANGTAVDIGANIGNHSLFFAEHFRMVHSFEPNPRTFGALTLNAALVDNVVVHNVALGERTETATLTFDPLNIGEASLSAGAGGSKMVDVKVERLDDLADQFDDIAFVKIDVEGFEPQVIAGTRGMIERFHPVIAFEQNRNAFADGRSATAELLISMGYRLCVFAKRNEGHGVAGHALATLRKAYSGTVFDVVAIERLTPGHYPMVVAVSDADLALLAGARP